ncbi:Set3 complex subunit [Cadophora gregata]|uniref:Set3 complex subunit n=1 Tax=Cadophora gregata TaxID=51156 RepID=UPI0026DCED53|nr:Set3 complex subunit [Cadophora gregata]KAK0124561.1 Set3 complex subunit [Cadophora gregata]KAK0129586.1 Set3 complex subunit [Cadophora gregata f. sp. sojae]
MDAQAIVDAVAARLSAEPDASVTEPAGTRSAATGTPNGIRSSPPVPAKDEAMEIDRPNTSTEEPGEKSDSEAETIVLPGKDGHSPSKIRKTIKHEDKSDDEEMRDVPGTTNGNKKPTPSDGDGDAMPDNPSEATATSTLGKRKRAKHGTSADDTAHLGNSSGLSSVPTSPVATTRSSLSKPAASDSEVSRSPSPRSRSRSALRDKAKSVDRAFPRRGQYASVSGDEDETEPRTFGRQRSSGADHKSGRPKGHNDINPRKRTRSISPQPRSHKRSISSQLPSKSSHGLSHKKKRVPAPLQSTEYHSDDSSVSGNSHPRSSRLRSLAAPTTGESAISPAKMAPHKKHVNSSGQTLLAIACSRGRLENVKQRYEERPEDLNLADNAMNTPLHTASLGGHVEIVKFLLDTGNCELDCVNLERDTPLHDAVDNKNVEVVKLLLEAGANPSKPNLMGNEPLDLIVDMEGESGDDSDDEEERLEAMQKATEMREAIVAAKLKFAGHRRGSEDHHMHDNGDGRLSHPKGSPRQTPPANENLGPTNRIARTARSSMKTKDRNLWKGYTIEELQTAASEGDLETTNRILNVKPNVNDARTLYNAARGGHDNVINLLFALGNFSPDPPALEGVPIDQSTPILAAIGKDNHLEVIKLFLGNADFDPTRRIKGETYYELAKRRAGPYWQEEEQLLKNAFNSYKKSHKASPGKPRSPGLRRDARDVDTRKVRTEEQQPSRSHKRSTSSPKTGEAEPTKSAHRSTSSLGQSKDGQNITKRGPGRPRKEEHAHAASGAVSDRDTSPLGPPKQKNQSRRSESDVAVLSENEPTVKPRRKLVSGKELRGERELEKQRRASIVSNASTASVKEKRVPSDSKQDKSDGKSSPNVPRVPKNSGSAQSDRDQPSDKDRARPLKRDDSKDRLSAIRGESPVKRPRKSETPPRSGMQEVTPAYEDGPHQKRRKLEADASSGHKTDSDSPEHRTSIVKSTLSRDSTAAKSTSDKAKHARPTQKSTAPEVKDQKDSSTEKSSRAAKSGRSAPTSPSESSKKSKVSERASKDAKDDSAALAKLEEEEAQKEAQLLREKEDAEAEAARLKEIEDQKIEQAKQTRLARERAEREEEEKREQEEAERKEQQRLEAEQIHKKMLEEREAKQKAIFLEQERVKKEEAERRRAAQEEAKRLEKARIEKERKDARLAKLPLLLKWFDLTFDQPNGHQSPEIVDLFKRIVGYRYDTIKPEYTGQTVGREQWMLNTHAAILLGEQDLHLSRFSAWDRVPLTYDQKRAVWSTHNSQYLLYDGWSSLRKFLPATDECHDDVIKTNRSLFLDLDLFFVKVSEFMFIVPTIAHLRSVQLKVEYRELHAPQTDLGQALNVPKWRSDPETAPGQTSIPEPKFYVNGDLVRQGGTATRVLKHPPPLDRFPRREGVTRVQEHDPDYEEQCRKQRVPGYQSSPISSTNPHMSDVLHSEQMNGITPPRSDQSKSINGGSPHRSSGSGPESGMFHQLPNGISTGGSPPPALS